MKRDTGGGNPPILNGITELAITTERVTNNLRVFFLVLNNNYSSSRSAK